MSPQDLVTTPIGFASEVLGVQLYPWQDRVITWYENAPGRRVKGSLCTPNGAGKDSMVIATLALWWVAVHRRGRVVITSKDARQIDEQTWPALERHRPKFAGWKWIEREIETPTGGKIILFTTDDAGRAEGFHRETRTDGSPSNEGPLLLIANEAKSIPDDIFSAFDRCTFDGLLYTSSPGSKDGRFYDSQIKPEHGFKRMAIGLKDCPHIPEERINDIVATYGPNSPFTRSTLYGEFMELWDGNPVYYAYNPDAHEFETLPWPSGAMLCVGMDVGTHNASTIAAVKEDKRKNLHIWIMREIILEGSDTDRQCVELLKVLANEFPFWNQGGAVCPASLFFCDPAARNSAFTSRGPTSSALKVIHSHGIFPGFKIGLGLQPSIATVNRLLQQNHLTEDNRTVWHFKINKTKCPILTSAMRGKYRYPKKGEIGWGSDLPLKGAYCDHVDHICDSFRYLCANALDIAPESYSNAMRVNNPVTVNPEPKRVI